MKSQELTPRSVAKLNESIRWMKYLRDGREAERFVRAYALLRGDKVKVAELLDLSVDAVAKLAAHFREAGVKLREAESEAA